MIDYLALLTTLTSGQRRQFNPVLPLAHSQAPLHQHQVLRLLPGKRLVSRCAWGGQPVIAKLFFGGRQAYYRARQDAAGTALLRKHHIPTAPLLYNGQVSGCPIYVLLYADLNPIQQFTDYWSTANPAEQQRGLRRLLEMMGSLHAAGLWHSDPHFSNFLVKQQTIYVVDGYAIRKSKQPLRKTPSLRNLGLLLAQLPAEWPLDLPAALASYSAQRGDVLLTGTNRIADWKAIQRFRRAYQRQQAKKYAKKVLRANTQQRCIKTPQSHLLLCSAYDTPSMQTCLNNLDTYLQQAVLQLTINKATQLSVINYHGQALLVLRQDYSVLNICRLLSKSLLISSWQQAHSALLRVSDNTRPIPVALLTSKASTYAHRRVAYAVYAIRHNLITDKPLTDNQ